MKKFLLIISMFIIRVASGQTIGNITLTNAYTNEAVSLSQYTTPIIVVFTSNECPFDNYYKTRIKEMITAYQGKIQFLLINSNPDAQESAEKMVIHYADLGVPYLTDKDQKAMEAFGAHKTPEVFVLKPEGGKFSVQYNGAIDDNPQVATDVKQFYLKEAIEKLMSGTKIEVANNRAVGCTIRRK
jgi:thioredoxin-related protein